MEPKNTPKVARLTNLVSSPIEVFGAFAFVLIMALVGVPVWWWTTEVPRVPLPYSDISSLEDRLWHIHFSLTLIDADDTPISAAQMSRIVAQVHERLGSLQVTDHLVLHFSVMSASISQDRRSSWNFTSNPTGMDLILSDLVKGANVTDWPGPIDHHYHSQYFWLINSALMGDKIYMGSERAFLSRLFPDFPVVVEAIMKDLVIGLALLQQDLDRAERKSDSSNSAKSLLLSPRLSLEFYLPSNAIIDSTWSEGLTELFFDRLKDLFLNQLQLILDTSVQSQVLHQLDLIPSNKKHDFRLDTDMSNILVRHVDQFVVSSAVEPTLLNFIIVPTPHSLLTDGDTDAVIANWGGLTVFSWNENGSRTDAYDRLLVAIIKQTRNLLGLNRNTTEISNQWASGVSICHSNAFLSSWEVDRLSLHLLVKWTFSSCDTLKSLVKLLHKISNLVINDDISREVLIVVSALNKIFKGDVAESKLKLAGTAYQHAENAYLDPTLLALLYFPEDQKYAIYVPLFLPAGVPVLISLKLIYKHFL